MSRTLIVAGLLSLVAGAAHAGPLAGVAAAAVAGFSGAGLLAAAGKILVGFGVSYLASRLTAPSLSQETARRKAGEVSSLVPKRWVYGRAKVMGAPFAYDVIDDTAIIGYILNSRPSDMTDMRIFFDKREVEIGGFSPFNMAGNGGIAQNGVFGGGDGSVRIWVGRGDQVGPPAFLFPEFGGYLRTTDGFRGCTVLWLRLNSGSATEQQKRWPRWLPEVEVVANWSRIRDTRVPAQTSNDATWQFSRNRSMIVLDFLLRNPMARHLPSQIDIPSFEAAANADDEAVALKAGGTEPRWTANGMVLFDGVELEETAETLYSGAGTGYLVRVGGKITATRGKWNPPQVTLTEIIAEDGLEFSDLDSNADAVFAVEGSYIRPAADWQTSSGGRWNVPGADISSREVRSFDLPFVTSPTQAQRKLSYESQAAGAQKRLRATFPPEAFDCVAGDVVTLATPVTQINGTYLVQSSVPRIFDAPGGGVAMRVEMELVETAANHYTFTTDDERDIEPAPEVNGFIGDLRPPGAVAVANMSGDRIKFDFAASPSKRVTEYQWEWLEVGVSWEPGGVIDAAVRDSGGKPFGRLNNTNTGSTYRIRVRAVDVDGSTSAWVASPGILAD